MPIKEDQVALSRELIQAFDELNGLHPGFRPAHAKGILVSGVFVPSTNGRSLTKAPHLQGNEIPVTVRFSDFAGIPSVPDNGPNASPRGIAIRFHLGEHVHTDIVAHSIDGFPTRTAEEFLGFLRALHASGPDTPKPTPMDSFLATHPAALEFVQTPQPFPSSFVKETFYAVNAYKFTAESGSTCFGRYRIQPENGGEYLDSEAAGKKDASFLVAEIAERLKTGSARMRIAVQIAASGDTVDDSTVHWPKDRPIVEFGTIELRSVAPDNDAEQRHIIFDPIPRVEGIESSGDPLLEPRAAVYLMSGRRRRAAGEKQTSATSSRPS
jgi:catalase